MSWGDQLVQTRNTLPSSLATAVQKSLDRGAAPLMRGVRRARGLTHFEFEGRELPYVVDAYNTTWRNERAAEVAIALDWLSRRPSGPVLEIGHVTGHYRPLRPGHTVVDLYEPDPAVLNVDARTYVPAEPVPSILAISTIEHVGYDEEDQDLDKPLALLDHLEQQLTPGGEMLVSFPLGYHPRLDRDLLDGSLKLERVTVLRRRTTLGEWSEAPLADVPRIRYGIPFERGNGIAVGYRTAPPE